MCLGNVTHVDPEVYATGRYLVLELSLGGPQYSLIRCVQVLKTIKGVYLVSMLASAQHLHISSKHTIGPNTMGGLMVDKLKLGFSFLIKSHAAFSANVLLARYPIDGFSSACSAVMGFQSSSEYVCPGQNPWDALIIAANEDVITTCLTVGALFFIDFKIPVVPMTAGSIRS